MKSMSDDIYPLTVTASCGHAMAVRSKEEQEEFEADHRERCNADDQFVEQVDNNPMYS